MYQHTHTHTLPHPPHFLGNLILPNLALSIFSNVYNVVLDDKVRQTYLNKLHSYCPLPKNKHQPSPQPLFLVGYPICKYTNMFFRTLIKVIVQFPPESFLQSFYFPKHSELWCLILMLGIVVPMDTDFCTVAMWEKWDLRIFLVKSTILYQYCNKQFSGWTK